ncbi:MAG: DNA repair protein RecO [Thermodesulfobacteriota bacterium]|jgi:DNA repair protein RecO (recombination protein O)
MLEERTPAIVLRARIHGESDKIVTFVTRDWGKVTGIAKGAKRSRRRFVNVLEPFTHVHLRFRPGQANELAFIFGCDLVRSFQAPSRDLRRFALASYAAELVDAMVVGREPGQEIYTLLLDSLTLLEDDAAWSPLFLPAFEFLLLTHVGYEPNLTACQHCGAPLPEPGCAAAFSPSLGGLLCGRCREHGGATLVLSAETLHLLRRPKRAGLRALLAAEAPSRVCHEVRALAARLLTHHLPRPLKSLTFLEQAGIPQVSSVDAPRGE